MTRSVVRYYQYYKFYILKTNIVFVNKNRVWITLKEFRDRFDIVFTFYILLKLIQKKNNIFQMWMEEGTVNINLQKLFSHECFRSFFL